jgi:protein SCO1
VSKRSLYALIVALFIPLACYFIIKSISDRTVVVPPHYFADSIISTTIDGKRETDTVWHQLPDFKLLNQLGQKVGWDDMKGKVVVADFFFTHCPTICPGMTRNMRELQQSIHNNEKVGDRQADFVQFLSFSVDPGRDSVAALKKWADRFQIDPANWWLLTGEKKTIYDLCINDMKLAVVDGEGVDTSFIHSDRFILIDRDRHVRGFYHGLDTTSLAKLSEDIIFLSLEKDPRSKSFLAGKLELIAIVFGVAILAVILLIFLLKRKP